jgi:hypothetical protein
MKNSQVEQSGASQPASLPRSGVPATDTVDVQTGDIVVSKFGNRWRCEAWQSTSTERLYVLRNRPQEVPDAHGTVYSGPLPEWADRVERDGLRVWQRPTPKCECPSFAKAKGPYPSGFCPDCGRWFPGVTRAQAIARGDISPSPVSAHSSRDICYCRKNPCICLRHDAQCESESTTHGYMPCRCEERANALPVDGVDTEQGSGNAAEATPQPEH